MELFDKDQNRAIGVSRYWSFLIQLCSFQPKNLQEICFFFFLEEKNELFQIKTVGFSVHL